MKLTPQPYLFTTADTTAIQGLGYQIRGTGGAVWDDFINREFPNFNLLALLKMVEQSFTPLTPLPITREINFRINPTALRIYYQNESKNDPEDLCFVRVFTKTNKDILVDHTYCILPEEHQRKKLAKPVFQESLQQYVNMDAKMITVFAGLQSGGYAWARHGFVAINRLEVEGILAAAGKQLNSNDLADAEQIVSKYYTDFPKGKEFPMFLWAKIDAMKKVLLESNWHGTLDLKNQEQLINFSDYVFRK